MGILIAAEPRPRRDRGKNKCPTPFAGASAAARWKDRWPSALAALLLAVPCLLPASGRAEPPEATRSISPAVVVLQINEDVEVGSTIVRVGDVLTPVGPPPDGWKRAAQAPIGLLPADGRRLRIERQRLMEILARLKLIAEPVRLSGSDSVCIRYTPPLSPAARGEREQKVPLRGRNLGFRRGSQPGKPATGAEKLAEQAIGQIGTSQQDVSVRRTNYSGEAAPRTERSTADGSRNVPVPLAPAERNRIRRMIESAFERTHAEIVATSELQIDDSDPLFRSLDGIREIRSLRLSGAPGDQDLCLAVTGDTELAPIEATIRIELHPLPTAVVTTRALNRGDLVSAGDVQLAAVPRNRHADDLITSIQSVVGMEVKRSVSIGRTIRVDDVTAPILIRRGELVELRVVGGGVTVTTAARALGSAAEGEPVTVETNSPGQPRRRHLARAVSSAVVEIVTRPPSTAHPAQRPSGR